MSTAAVSTTSIYQELQTYFQARNSDLKQLGQALQSGDLATAQQEFSAIQNLGQGGPFANGNEFKSNQRQQDFNAIGQALQAGDLAGAQQAFAQLKGIFHHQHSVEPQEPILVNLSVASTAAPAPAAAPPPTAAAAPAPSSTSAPHPTATSTAPAPGTEIILNLGNFTPGEQINIGISNGSNGSEQVTIGVSNQQNQSAEQITLNLNQNTNQQIILNLFNSTASSTAQGSGVNLTA
jgi:hypothetical protein